MLINYNIQCKYPENTCACWHIFGLSGDTDTDEASPRDNIDSVDKGDLAATNRLDALTKHNYEFTRRIFELCHIENSVFGRLN